MYRAAALFTLIASLGCAVRRPNYSLAQQLLIPPGVNGPDVTQRTIDTGIAASKANCPVPSVVRRGRLLVPVNRDALLKKPGGWLTAWAAGLEAQGCIKPGEGSRLAELMAESLPLSADAAFRLLYANDVLTGEVDIGPHTRLQVVSPIQIGEAAPSPIISVTGNDRSLIVTANADPNMVGVETAWYGVSQRPGGNGLAIAPLYADRRIQGATNRTMPEKNYFHFPDDAACYRLFYKAGQTDYTALVIAGRTRAELDARTKALEAGEITCEALKNSACVAIPKRAAINPFFSVTVNGKETMVNFGARVGGAIRSGGAPDVNAVLSTLTVSRLYKGRSAPVEFDRQDRAILNLVLLGGESIAWH